MPAGSSLLRWQHHQITDAATYLDNITPCTESTRIQFPERDIALGLKTPSYIVLVVSSARDGTEL